MRARWVLIAVVLLLILVGPAGPPVRAQGNRKVIKITMVSWKFTPDLFTVTQGDTVVLQLSNEDPDKRNHSFAARWLVGKQVTVRGTVAREGIDDERRFFAVAPGTQNHRCSLGASGPANDGEEPPRTLSAPVSSNHLEQGLGASYRETA